MLVLSHIVGLVTEERYANDWNTKVERFLLTQQPTVGHKQYTIWVGWNTDKLSQTTKSIVNRAIVQKLQNIIKLTYFSMCCFIWHTQQIMLDKKYCQIASPPKFHNQKQNTNWKDINLLGNRTLIHRLRLNICDQKKETLNIQYIIKEVMILS